MQANNERLLDWVQKFYALKEQNLSLLNYIPDEQIPKYSSFEKILSLPGMLKIYTVSNPGFLLKYFHKGTIYENISWYDQEINLELEYNEHWFCNQKKEESFNSIGGPLYLSICLESFRCFIEREELVIDDLITFREKLKINNQLLAWLEEFYFSYCDRDEYDYGYSDISISLISVQNGWIMVILLEELELSDSFEKTFIKENEGNIECYMLGSQFIIRAHHRGLITGIKIFKEWIESQPKYEEKRKYID